MIDLLVNDAVKLDDMPVIQVSPIQYQMKVLDYKLVVTSIIIQLWNIEKVSSINQRSLSNHPIKIEDVKPATEALRYTIGISRFYRMCDSCPESMRTTSGRASSVWIGLSYSLKLDMVTRLVYFTPSPTACCFQVETEDAYKDMQANSEDHDFSEYQVDSPYYNTENKKLVGKIKD